MSHMSHSESYKSHCLGLLSKYQEKERRKKNWPLLDLSASPQLKMIFYLTQGRMRARVRIRVRRRGSRRRGTRDGRTPKEGKGQMSRSLQDIILISDLGIHPVCSIRDTI